MIILRTSYPDNPNVVVYINIQGRPSGTIDPILGISAGRER